MSDSEKAILLTSGEGNSPIIGEAISAAGSAMVPGMLAEFTATGEIQEHGTADGISQKAVVMPNLPVGGTIDDAYDEAVVVRFAIPKSGSVVNAWLADAQTATQATALVSNGDGTLKIDATPADAAVGSVFGYPIESVTTSGAISRIKVRVL